jgi:DNA-binding MarR family transcriptional regulator
MKTSLYRHFDSEGILLYVGVSLSQLNRLQQHSRNAKWFDKITSVTIEHFETRELALEAEAIAIMEEEPLYNKTYNVKSTVRKQLGEFMQLFIQCPSMKEQTILLILLKNYSSGSDSIRLALSEICLQSGLSKPTAIKAIDSLCELKYVTRVGKQAYKISPNLAWFGNQVDWAVAIKEEK